MNNKDVESKIIDLLTDDELENLNGGINVYSEEEASKGVQGVNHCCNTTNPPVETT
jgi:hypothetical protein